MEYVVILNRAAAEDLYAWRPIGFESSWHHALRVAESVSEIETGDLCSIIETKYVSEIVPHLNYLLVHKEGQWIQVPPFAENLNYCGKNWVDAFESPSILPEDLWKYYGYSTQTQRVKIALGCFGLVENPFLDPLTRKAFSYAAAKPSALKIEELRSKIDAKSRHADQLDPPPDNDRCLGLGIGYHLCGLMIYRSSSDMINFMETVEVVMAATHTPHGTSTRLVRSIKLAQTMKSFLSFQTAALHMV